MQVSTCPGGPQHCTFTRLPHWTCTHNSAEKLNHGLDEGQKMCSAGRPPGQGLKTPGIGHITWYLRGLEKYGI